MRRLSKPAFLLIFLFLSSACNPFDNNCPIMGHPEAGSDCDKAMKKKYGYHETTTQVDVASDEELISRPDGDFSVSRIKSNGNADCIDDKLSYSKSEQTIKGDLCGKKIDKTFSKEDIEKIEAGLDDSYTSSDLFGVLEDFAED
ncbi:MAG: hypothetical protein V4655_02605 [Bdellovibrionota bacterium]